MNWVLKPNNRKESQTADSAKRCRFHFLLTRKIELDSVNNNSLDDLRRIMSNTVTEYGQLPPVMRLRDKSRALATWSKEI